MDKKERLSVKIDLPSFQLEIESSNPSAALPELRRMLEAVSLDDQVIYEEFVAQELKSLFSDEFTSNEKLMRSVKKLLKQEEDYRVLKMELPITATIDLDRGTRQISVNPSNLRQSLVNLSEKIPGELVKHGIVHVSGSIPDNEKLRIVDNIHTQMPTAQLRAFQSSGTDDQALIECIFFGEFFEDEE